MSPDYERRLMVPHVYEPGFGGAYLYDLAIVGGGPTGSRLACQLVRYGHRVVVFEARARDASGACCTGIIGQECVRTFAVPDHLILRQVNRARLFSPSGKQLLISRDRPQAAVLDRAGFDRYLAQQAQDAGAEYHYESSVVTLEIAADGADLEVKRAGQSVSCQARAVVLATGFKPRLLAKTGLAGPGRFLVGAQTEVDAPEIQDMEVYFGREVAPGFFAWLVPTTAGRARVGLLTHRRPGHYLAKLMAALREQGKIASAAGNVCYQGLPLQPLPRTCADRLLVIGTAAGQVKPTTGGGIYYGLLGADIAAATLHRALEDNELSARKLMRYDRQWRRRLGSEIKKGGRVRYLYNRLSDHEINRLFDKLDGSDLLDRFLSDNAVAFDWHSSELLKLLSGLVISQLRNALKSPFKPLR